MIRKRRKTLRAGIAILLTAVFFTQGVSILADDGPARAVIPPSAAALKETGHTSDAGAEDAVILYEEESLRGEFEKHFVRSDGTNVAVSYGEPVHVQQADGSWTDIDNSLSVQGDRIRNTDMAAYQVSFASEREDAQMVRLSDKGYELSWSLEAAARPDLLRGAAARQAVRAAETADIQNAVLEIADRPELEAVKKTAAEVLYPNVLNRKADLRYTVKTGKITEELIIKDTAVCAQLVQHFDTNGLEAVKQTDGSVEFQDDDGCAVFTLLSPVLYDAAEDMTRDIEVTVVQNGSDCTVTYEPDRAWMEAENRIMPLSLWTSVRTNTVRSNFKDTYVYEDDVNASNHINEEKMWVGFKSEPNVSGLKNHHALWKCVNLPTIVGNITGASFYLQCTDGTSTSRPFSLCRINEDWDDVNVRYHTQPDDNCIVDNAPRQSNNQVVFTNQYVTDTVSGWYSGTYRNYGFKIRYTNESRDNPDYNVFYTSDHSRTEYMPYLTIDYSTPSVGTLLKTAPADGLYCYLRNGDGEYLRAGGAGSLVGYGQNTDQHFKETIFLLRRISDGLADYYYIQPAAQQTEYMDIYNAWDTENNSVGLYQHNPNYPQAQLYAITNQCGDLYTIRPKLSSNKVLTLQGVEYGLVIKSYSSGNLKQLWHIEIATPPGIDGNATYFLKNANTGGYLDVDYAYDTNMANVSSAGFNGNANQQWKLVQNTNGTFKLVPQHGSAGRVLDISGGNLDIYTDNGQSYQHFFFLRDVNGKYYIKNAGGLYAQSTANGNSTVNANMTADYSGSNTRWTLEKVSKGNAKIYCDPDVVHDLISVPGTTDGKGIDIDDFTVKFMLMGYKSKRTFASGSEAEILNDIGGSEIYFHAGHSYSGTIGYNLNEDDVEPCIIDGQSVRDSTYNLFKNTRCFITVGCTAGASDEYGRKIIDELYRNGAHFSLGFLQKPNVEGAKRWLREFTRVVKEGKTINSAISAANIVDQGALGFTGLPYYIGDTSQILTR